MTGPLIVQTAIGDYPHTQALLDGRVTSELVQLEFAAISPISRAFAPMVRHARFDVSEMAIATFLQAKAADIPLVLLPVVMAARYQEAALLCRVESDIDGPAGLAGRRVGVRAYSQTTGMWLRGILMEDHGVRPDQVQWVTFEDAHVEGIADPPWAVRASPGQDMMAMLAEGSLDAVIVGNDVPDDPGLRTVFADPAAASRRFAAQHHLMPVNHLVCMRWSLADERPDVAAELVRMFAKAARLAPGTLLPAGRAALDPAVELALRYCTEQSMLLRKLTLAEVWDGLPAVD